jgi:hypothetical protein
MGNAVEKGCGPLEDVLIFLRMFSEIAQRDRGNRYVAKTQVILHLNISACYY